jgi:osmoprotectant transport system permease protein
VSFWDYLAGHHQQLLTDAFQQASAVFQCMVIATLLGILIALLTYRSTWRESGHHLHGRLPHHPLPRPDRSADPDGGPGRAAHGDRLTLYGLLPIVRNAIVGLRGVDPSLVDAAKGIGMSRTARLFRVELPLAWPPILTGIRVSTQMLMGIAAIAAYASGPGLGNEIFRGIASLGSANAINQVLAGTVGIVILALLFDAAYVLLGRLTISRGIRD